MRSKCVKKVVRNNIEESQAPVFAALACPNGEVALEKLPAFARIELLIVVAIIAIWALIAVPQFLEAQMRSKVARVRTDARTVLVALEAYFVDHTGYPRHRDFP